MGFLLGGRGFFTGGVFLGFLDGGKSGDSSSESVTTRFLFARVNPILNPQRLTAFDDPVCVCSIVGSDSITRGEGGAEVEAPGMSASAEHLEHHDVS